MWVMTVLDQGPDTGYETDGLRGTNCHRFTVTLKDEEGRGWWNTTADGEQELGKVKAEANTILILLNNGFLPRKPLGSTETAATSQEEILEGFWWRGFQDGFRGVPAAAVSDFHEPQDEYFKGFTAGRANMAKIEEIAAKENVPPAFAVNRLMRKALDEYHYRHYG